MFATVEPGVNFLELQAAAQRAGCRLLNPSTAATAGVLSNHLFCNINTMASKYGFGMDNIIDVEVVLPTGDIFRCGPSSYGAVKGAVAGPGPDMSPMFRYAFGSLGTVTRMTVRLYPEAPVHSYLFPSYEEDRLEVLAEALQMVAQDNLSLELAHLMNSFYGIFIGDNNAEASKVTELMPRHNLLTVFGGETEEEADLKAALTQRKLVENYPMFDYLPKEAIDDMTEEYEFVDWEKWLKFFNVTVRVQRVRGSFMIGGLIDRLSNMVAVEKMMRSVCTDQVGTNDDALRPDDASTYLQPYHMGRSAYMEYDLYTNQADKDDLIRMLMAYFKSTFKGMGEGMLFAAGMSAMITGIHPMVEMAIEATMPNLVQLMRAYKKIKVTLDPNNVACRRWEYEDDCAKKFVMF
jgi:FAD binding domain